MEQCLLSVVVPVYNAAAYLQDCVLSVLNFPFVGEVILIDDGSTDGSAQSCDALEKAYPAVVRAVHQQNRGVSAARNRGICLAHGRWLWFVDADDRVMPPSESDRELLSRLLTGSDVPFVQMGFFWDEGGKVDRYGASADEIPYNLWRCLFRRTVVNEAGLFFSLGRKYAEDQEFILRFLLYAGHDVCGVIGSQTYYYTMRPGSAMNRPGTRRMQVKDLSAVICNVILGWGRSAVSCPWMVRVLRRMAKSLWVTAIK